LERELRNGLIQGEFEVYYQPQVSLEDGAITGVGALVRWRHNVRGMIEPAEFFTAG
jgi:EAL domain-containing protein (putative c-di-GMP-specific phosphodiesterase class I)